MNNVKRIIERISKEDGNFNKKLEVGKNIKNDFLNINKYLKTLIENTLDIIMVLDVNNTICYINESVEQIFDKSPEQLIGTKMIDYIHPKERGDFKNRCDALFDGKIKTDVSEFIIRKKKGSFKIVESISQKIKDRDGNPCLLVNSRDVTERAKVQRILTNSQKQLLTAQKIAQIGSWEWDIGKDVFRWSKELHRICGINSGKYLTDLQGFLKYVQPNHREEITKAIDKAIEHRSTFELESRIERTDSEERIVFIKGEVFNDDDIDVKVIATCQDITNLKGAENKLREYSEQLRHFNAKQDMIIENERNQIAREIHDDLGQMLAVLKMDVFLVKERAKQEIGEKSVARFREDMQGIFEKFDTLINSVQRITTNLRPEVIKDLGVIEAIKWQCHDFEQQTGISCTFTDKSHGLDNMIKEYKNAFFRILQQALNNIGEHAGATKAEIMLSADDKFLLLKIWDNGVGIKDNKVRHPNSLGILSMRERSHYLGGEFSIEGKPNEGTTVTLKIPLDEIIFKY